MIKSEEIKHISDFINALDKDAHEWMSSFSARLDLLEGKYDPNQPRVPAGNPDGGQWTDGGGGEYPDAIEEVSLEGILSAVPAVRAASAIRGAVSSLISRSARTRKFNRIAKGIEKYLGGKPDRIINRSNSNFVIMKDKKKIRFDVKYPHGYDPHFHIQEMNEAGKWTYVGKHHYNFKE